MGMSPEFQKKYIQSVVDQLRAPNADPMNAGLVQPGIYIVNSVFETILIANEVSRRAEKPTPILVDLALPGSNDNPNQYAFNPDAHIMRGILPSSRFIVANKGEFLLMAGGTRLVLDATKISASGIVENGQLRGDLHVGYKGTLRELRDDVSQVLGRTPENWLFRSQGHPKAEPLSLRGTVRHAS